MSAESYTVGECRDCCENCRYGKPGATPLLRECHKTPPTVPLHGPWMVKDPISAPTEISDDSILLTERGGHIYKPGIWPSTNKGDWCGEWKDGGKA